MKRRLHETAPWKKGYQQQVGISTEKKILAKGKLTAARY
jgi:hypothetical protein